MKYHMTYKIDPHPEGLTKEQIPEGCGACHAMIITSIIYPPDGSLNVSMYTWDGRPDHPDSLDSNEKFKIWMMMAKQLADDPNLHESRRALASMPFEIYRNAMLQATAREVERDDN